MYGSTNKLPSRFNRKHSLARRIVFTIYEYMDDDWNCHCCLNWRI